MDLLNRAKNLLGTDKPSEAPRGEAASPASAPAITVTGRNRIPLSIPRLKLEVPKIPGYVCQWFADRPGRLRQAQEAGYEFVSPDEMKLNNLNPADDPLRDGNTDLGNAVSIYGGVSEQGVAERLYLMKIQEAWWKEDQKVIADRNEGVAQAIRGGNPDMAPNPSPVEGSLQYGGMQSQGRPSGAPPRKQQPNIFTRKRAT